ncbi:Signal transduction histidine kinase [Chitinophaga jiangningensis]|uniref:histidine kinase n=1 Tax=Chitinophaga jiangningensis TaxID=1419482 RepID=A0A1M7JB49_9BACT|nr:two-component regulator propeller domain-containing protein [Chitinophaga jiangningensis]SHM50249.1 Signal transduction histidine kinase [Chitinophaga jiangningensis]
MKSFCKKFFHVIICLQLLTSIASYAGYPVRAYLGIDQGLSNNFVRCIYQDRNGFMWFGTYDGLNRFDGYEFKIFRNNFKNTRSLINNWINSISEDQQGNLWIGTRQGASIYHQLTDDFSVLYYKTGEGKQAQLQSVVKAIKADGKGNMFVATADNGLLFFEHGKTTGATVVLQDNAHVVYDVTTVEVANDGQVWFFVADKGLYRYDYVTHKGSRVTEVLRSANCIKALRQFLWIGTNDGLQRYNITANTFDKVYRVENGKLKYNAVAGITVNKPNELWIATNGGGVAVLNTDTDQVDFLSVSNEPNTLSSNAVYAIWIDKQERKWIGCLRGGVNIIDPNKERFHNVFSAGDQSLASNYILSFYEAPNRDVWIGTDGDGLSIWNRKTNTFTNYRHEPGNPYSLSDNFVTDIRADDPQHTWIITYRGGVNRFSKGKFERYDCVDPLHPQVVLHPIGPGMLEDQEKTCWLTTQQYGLFKLNRQKKVFELFDSQLKDLYALREDRDQVLWGGGINYVFRIDRRQKAHAAFFIGKPVNVMKEDRAGNFWLGTEGGGLILFDRKQGKIIARYTTDEGLCSNSVLTILEDAAGNLWMSTFNGIAKFNPTTKTFRSYYQGDGLQSNQFNYHAAIQLASGEFAFGGIKGFSLFHPENMAGINSNPKVFLTNIKVSNMPLEADTALELRSGHNQIEQITIPYYKAILSFGFAALEYSAPDKIQYAYFLEGSDKGWIYSGDSRKAVYSHLSEGTYTFRVKNTNAEGQWMPEEAQVKIIVLPPWYRSWWAWLIYTLLAIVTLYYYLQYRSRRVRLQFEVKIAKLNAENERLEKERSLAELAKEKTELERERAEREREQAESEKERILNKREREITEKKISFFTSISHEFRTPLTLIINPVKELLDKDFEEQYAKGELHIVYRNARRMLSLVDQLLLFRKTESGLDHIRPSRLNLHDLACEVYLCFVRQAHAQRVTYEFDCPDKQLELYADPEKLEIILYNLLSNALKYTPAGGTIRLLVEDAATDVVIRVEDTGVGIPADTGDKVFEKFYKVEKSGSTSRPGFGIGLFLVKHFAVQHRGTIFYNSEEGRGTTFTLTFHKGKAHFPEDVVISETIPTPQLPEVLKEDVNPAVQTATSAPLPELVSGKQSILIIDDDEGIREYLARLFKDTYLTYLAGDGETGLAMAKKYLPDLVISDIHMKQMSGIELCKAIKENEQLNHIPVILLTGATSDELKLQGVEGGADDYIVKPFDSKLVIALVATLLRNRSALQKYFYNEITLTQSNFKVSAEYKELLEKCILIVEKHLKDKHFSIQTLLQELGMSHSNLLRKVKLVSGQPVNIFIRSIRLRKAAELFINTDYSIKETAYAVGIGDIKYFREQFNKLFGMNPSAYIKKYRKVHGKQFTVDKEAIDPGE